MMSPDDILDGEEKTMKLAKKILVFIKQQKEADDQIVIMASVGVFLAAVCKAHGLSKEQMLENMDETWDVMMKRQNV